MSAALETIPESTNGVLAIPEGTSLAECFTRGGLDPFIEKVRAEVAGFVPDISTEKGRAEIRSLAFKVAKSKTALDDMGKQLAAGLKAQTAAIDAERRRAWDELETLQKDVRAPLTEWETREKERVAGHEQILAEIVVTGQTATANWMSICVGNLQEHLDNLGFLKVRDWQEFDARALKEISIATEAVKAAIAKRSAFDAEQAELARLRQEEADRKQRERDERLQAEAAAKAKAEAEAEAKRKADAEAARAKAEQLKAEQERQRIQREKEAADHAKVEAELRAMKAESDRKDAIAKAEENRKAAALKVERDRIAAEVKAKQDALAAVDAERKRAEAERKAQSDAQWKRELDEAHRASIETEIIGAFIEIGLSREVAEGIISAINGDSVPHVKITY